MKKHLSPISYSEYWFLRGEPVDDSDLRADYSHGYECDCRDCRNCEQPPRVWLLFIGVMAGYLVTLLLIALLVSRAVS